MLALVTLANDCSVTTTLTFHVHRHPIWIFLIHGAIRQWGNEAAFNCVCHTVTVNKMYYIIAIFTLCHSYDDRDDERWTMTDDEGNVCIWRQRTLWTNGDPSWMGLWLTIIVVVGKLLLINYILRIIRQNWQVQWINSWKYVVYDVRCTYCVAGEFH